MAQHQIPFMNFALKVPETIAQHAFLNFIVIQNKGEYRLDCLEPAVLVL